MLAVYVNKDNPIEGLTLPQVDAIFSKTRKGGYPQRHPHLGPAGPDRRVGRQAPISLYGRNSASGTYGYLQGARPVQGRLQGRGQGAAGQLVGGAGRGQRQVRHRLQRHRLQDGRRARRAAGDRRRAKQFVAAVRERLHRRVPAGPVPLPVREPQAGHASSIRCVASSSSTCSASRARRTSSRTATSRSRRRSPGEDAGKRGHLADILDGRCSSETISSERRNPAPTRGPNRRRTFVISVTSTDCEATMNGSAQPTKRQPTARDAARGRRGAAC